MCWVEFIGQFSGASTGRVEWPSRWSIGCYVCPSRLKAHYRQNQDSIYFGVRKLLSKDLSFLPRLKKEIWQKWQKWCLSFENSVFSFEEGMFPSEKKVWYRKISTSFMHIQDMCFHRHHLQFPAPFLPDGSLYHSYDMNINCHYGFF